MQFAHVVHELALGVADIEQRLSRFGIREEDDEVHRMAAAQRDPDLGIVLEAADTRAVAAARVDDHVRAAPRVHRHALRRNDTQQRVVDRTLERAPVHDHLVVEVQDRRQSLPFVLDEDVAALAQRVPQEDRALCEVHGVPRAARPKLPRGGRLRRQPRDLPLGRLMHALAEPLQRHFRAGLQDLRDLRRHVVALGELSGRIAHGISLSDGL